MADSSKKISEQLTKIALEAATRRAWNGPSELVSERPAPKARLPKRRRPLLGPTPLAHLRRPRQQGEVSCYPRPEKNESENPHRMSETTPTTTPRRRGRPPGSKNKPKEGDVAALQGRIAQLEALLAGGAAPAAPAGARPVGAEPGTYWVVRIDKNGEPEYRKTPWTRAWMAAKYPLVTFTPQRSMKVAPNNVKYELWAGVEATVPSCVKDEYDRVVREQANIARSMTPVSAIEDSELAVRAQQNPGTRQWSRVSMTPGVPLYLGDEEDRGGIRA